MKNVNIIINNQESSCNIEAQVTSSQNASALADRLDKLPYLKVDSRGYKYPIAKVYCHAIKGRFSIDKIYNDLETMSDILDLDYHEKN